MDTRMQFIWLWSQYINNVGNVTIFHMFFVFLHFSLSVRHLHIMAKFIEKVVMKPLTSFDTYNCEFGSYAMGMYETLNVVVGK